MSARPRIYLDNAATSWPKAEPVYAAMDQFARQIGATAGRGDYASATASSAVVQTCRRRLMHLIHAGQAQDIAFFANGTAALNAAIFGAVRAGEHVVTSAMEHNSVLRPLHYLQQQGQIELSIVPCDARGWVDPDELLKSRRPHTALVTLGHASNVTGTVQAIETVGQALRDSATLFLCDGAQTLGYLPIDVQAFGIDLFAAPGHKGSGGPLGTALLYASEKARKRLRPTVFGGTGSQSESLAMPAAYPDALESGNLNVPAIAGWNAALEQLDLLRPAHAAHIASLCERLQTRFDDFRGGLAIVGQQLPIASLVFDDADPFLMGSLLDSEFGIEVRCGLHCAALVHEPIAVAWRLRGGRDGAAYQGTLRISAGHFTTLQHIDVAATAVHDLQSEIAGES